MDNLDYNTDNLSLDIFRSGMLTPENYRERITTAEEYLLTLPQVEPEVIQHFIQGVYSRTIIIPTGMILTGGVHKSDSIIFVSSGEIIVATENGNVNIKAPASFIGLKGTKRIAYCVSECTWTNVHFYDGIPLDEDSMKDIIVSTNYADYDIYLAREDYKKFLSEIGMTDLEVIELVIRPDDVVPFKEYTPVKVGDSKISCYGIISEKDFSIGEEVGKGGYGDTRTLLGRFTNHSNDPNVTASVRDDDLIFTAKKRINCGDEITVDYREVVALRSQI